MGSRLEKVRRLMAEERLDALLLTSRENKFYLAGLYSGSGHVLVTADGCHAVVDGRYYQQQRERMGEGSVLLSEGSAGPLPQIARMLEEKGVTRLGFEAGDVTYEGYQGIRSALPAQVALIPASLDRLRMVKDGEELSCIRRACAIADEGYAFILGRLRPGMTEKEVENRLLYHMKSIGARKESFDIIVASGENGAKPHAKAGDRVLREGDFVTMDFGARVGEYCSDLTRTVAVGRAGGRLCEAHRIVREAQEAAIRAICPGRRCCEIDRAAREVVREAGYGEYFIHNLGHGLGIMCHEAPAFSASDETVLEPGMVMTVEPGIYLEGIGGVRVEDDILVTVSGCEALTGAPRELAVVGRGGWDG